MARELFEQFSLRETGKPGNWSLLNSERKSEWMKDVLRISYFYAQKLTEGIKPLPFNQKHNTVYEAGFYDGIRSERITFIELVTESHQRLLEEFEEFKQINK